MRVGFSLPWDITVVGRLSVLVWLELFRCSHVFQQIKPMNTRESAFPSWLVGSQFWLGLTHSAPKATLCYHLSQVGLTVVSETVPTIPSTMILASDWRIPSAFAPIIN